MIVHPHIGNDKRQEVMNWCIEKFGPYNEEDSVWCATSNYDRSKDGTFDVHFEDMYEALWFLSKWGGEVVDLVQAV